MKEVDKVSGENRTGLRPGCPLEPNAALQPLRGEKPQLGGPAEPASKECQPVVSTSDPSLILLFPVPTWLNTATESVWARPVSALAAGAMRSPLPAPNRVLAQSSSF